MTRASTATHPAEAEANRPEPNLRDLVSYRIHRLAGVMARGAASRYRREFDVSLVEWRTIALLGDNPPLSLKQLAALAALDKSLISRTITALTERGFVQRDISAADAREVQLRLTPEGMTLHAGLMNAARQRDAAFRAALTAEELAALDGLMKKLEAEAKLQT